ncbi:hypothetical protein [Winogradskyella sp.]|uniref:hypothetical protein n=1 Tax=Winogradskyella sp. TaxID=1883156 RepID=UPI003BACDCAF
MRKSIKIISALIITAILLYFLFGGGLEEKARNELDKIELQVALDAEKQYEIAKNSGSDMDAYVQAGFVAAAYLEANDEVNYRKWKKIETQLARKLELE